jgi:hypothetical protein
MSFDAAVLLVIRYEEWFLQQHGTRCRQEHFSAVLARGRAVLKQCVARVLDLPPEEGDR